MAWGRQREWPEGLGVSRVRLVCYSWLESLFLLSLVFFFSYCLCKEEHGAPGYDSALSVEACSVGGIPV